MTPRFRALQTTLSWQQQDDTLRLQTIELQLNRLAEQRRILQQQLNNAFARPNQIIPEQEMARQHYIAHQQDKLNQLTQNEDNLISQQSSLLSAIKTVKTTLKRLERMVIRQQQHNRYQQALRLQTQLDEWIIYEN